MKSLLITSLILAAGALVSCDAPKQPQSVPIQVQLNWVPEPEFGGIYAALQEGLYAQAGLAVEVIKGGGQVPCAQLVASGQVPFAVVSGEEVLTLRARGGPIVAVFATFQKNPTGFLLHAENPINSLEALWRSDSTIGIDPGLPFVKMLNERYPGGAVKLVPYSGALATFLASPNYAQQCFITSEPVECQLRGIQSKVLSLADVFNPYAAVVATNETFLKEHPDRVDAFVRATAEGWRRYLDAPERYNPAIAALNPSMTLEAMNIAARLERPFIVPEQGERAIGTMSAARWQSLCEQLTATKVIESCGSIDAAFVAAPRAVP